jgi:hypothetical protein
MQWANWFIAPEGVATLESYYQLVRLVRLADLDCDDDDDEDGLTEGSVLFSSRFRLSWLLIRQYAACKHSPLRTRSSITSRPLHVSRHFSLTKKDHENCITYSFSLSQELAAWCWYSYTHAREQMSCISEWAGYPSGCAQKTAYRAVPCSALRQWSAGLPRKKIKSWMFGWIDQFVKLLHDYLVTTRPITLSSISLHCNCHFS